jgi:uncharacterized repeat protein (TIGR03803 family)
MTITLVSARFVRLAITAAAVTVAATTAVSAQQGATYEVVSIFDVADGRPNGVIQARNGLFYGTTIGGPPIQGPPVPIGTAGTVFAMDADGARTILRTFQQSGILGIFDGTPMSNLFEGHDGRLYGTTFNEFDSAFDPGQIFGISTTGVYTRVASRYTLRAGVIQARDGWLYGVTSAAANPLSPNKGSVFGIDVNGTGTFSHAFLGADSGNPVAELAEIGDGSLYGTTAGSQVIVPPGPVPVHGTIFRVDRAAGSLTTLHVFSGPDGSRPSGRLIQASNGLVYGTTPGGGIHGLGTVFSLDSVSTLTTLHHFAGPDGASPGAGVIQGTDGRLYGVTSGGGAFDYGTVFVMNVTGGLTTLHDFALSDGANPVNELFQAADGAFYGAAPMGGAGNSGVIFRVRLTTSPPVGYVELVSRNSGKCLDVFGASTDAAASVIQWVCHGGQNQQWRLEPAGGGAVRIIARHSGQALDVFGALIDDVTPIIQWPVHGGDNQVWTLEPTSDGHVRIVARHSGKAMDVEFASPDDGARVIQYTPHGGANQQWLLRPVE